MNPLDALPDVAAYLGVPLESIKFLRYSQNAVYEFKDATGEDRILRVTSSSHRTVAEIHSELAWIHYLHGCGLDVCLPVQGMGGSELFTSSDDSDTYHCVVFQRSKGHPIAKQDLSPSLYLGHGRHLGAMHAASKTSPPGILACRRKWNAERYFTTDIDTFLPEEHREAVRAAFSTLHAQALAHSPTKDTFGPVHFDLGYSNFHRIGDQQVCSFDFDNCAEGHFVGDIAAALYGSIFTGLRCEFAGDRAAFDHPRSSHNLEQVWQPFLEGYKSANEWHDEWNQQLTTWFKILYFRAVVHAWRILHPVTSPATKAALEADIEHIVKGTLPLRFDFVKGTATP